MKIVSVESFSESIPLTRPYAIATRAMETAALVFLRVRTSSGATGYGAASPEPHVTGETAADCAAALSSDSLAWLCGRDVRGLPRIVRESADRMRRAPAARAALDMALHDLLARQLDLPLVEMLGRAHEELPTSITVGIKGVAESLEEADEYVRRGFRVLKVKVGVALEEDVERLVKVRERVGSAVQIRADANQGYSAAETLAFFERTSEMDVEFLEQPVGREELASCRFPEAIRARIAADESLHDEKDALALAARTPACGIFNVKLMKCGGIFTAGRIGTIAEAAGISVMWGCMDESVVSIAAALHAAFACPATRYLDLDGSLDLSRDLFRGGFEIRDGVMRTIDRPGLGVMEVIGYL